MSWRDMSSDDKDSMAEHSGALRSRIEALQESISRLCGAILGINSRPDPDTVLLDVGDNARTCGDRHQVRADLETLVETSPVGVVVLDARTGRAVSLNREAKRIVRGLHMPGDSAKEPLELMTYRRGDGREGGLAELSLARLLTAGETVRPEEIELSIPGGRSVTALVNATPIRGEHGGIESVVVTMQDLAPLEEMERTQAEYLGIVKHRLRGALTSIKGSAAIVLATPRGVDRAEMLQFFRIIDERTDHMRRLIGDLLDAGRIRAANDGGGRSAQVTFAVPAAAEEADNEAADALPERPLRGPAESGPVSLGELVIDHNRRLVTLAGRRVNLTATEYELLRLLSSNRGRVLTYRSLLRQAWGTRHRGSVDPKLVHSVVRRLRQKLGEDAARPVYILNERGVGYRMRAPADP